MSLLPAHCVLCGARAEPPVPNLCAGCAGDLPVAGPACGRCAAPLPVGDVCGSCQRHPPEFDGACCALLYDDGVASLVHALKFRGLLAPAATLAYLLAATTRGRDRPDVLVPVPLHARRLRERGFNQAAEIARPLGRLVRVPVALGMVERQRYTQPQSALTSIEERRRNIAGAFRVRRGAARRLRGFVAIVDDVLTTGSTAAALAAALHRCGTERVEVWCAARVAAPPRSGV